MAWGGVLLLGCRPVPPRGTSAVERAQATAGVVHLAEDGGGRVEVALAIDAGFAWDPDGMEGSGFALAHARAARSPREVRTRWGVGPDVVLLRAGCEAPGSLCLEALSQWMMPVSERELDDSGWRDAAYEALQIDDPLRVARWALDVWLWEGLSRRGPPAGRVGLLPALRPREIVAHDRRHATRDGAVVGLSAAASSADVAAAMAASRGMPPRIHPPAARMTRAKPKGRSALVVPARATAWVVGHPATSSGETARAVGLMGLSPSIRSPTCEGEVVGWSSPEAQARQPTAWVGAPAATEGVVEEVIAWVSTYESVLSDDVGARSVWLNGRTRLREHLAAASADPGCALAWAVASAVVDRPDALKAALQEVGEVDVEALRQVLLVDLPPATWRLVIATDAPEETASALRQAEALGLEEVVVLSAPPWRAAGVEGAPSDGSRPLDP